MNFTLIKAYLLINYHKTMTEYLLLMTNLVSMSASSRLRTQKAAGNLIQSDSNPALRDPY